MLSQVVSDSGDVPVMIIADAMRGGWVLVG
jgi:hypothetical protein